jgi:hypothetical protein
MLILQVKLDLACLDDICDDEDFCCKLAKEDSVIVLPGMWNFHIYSFAQKTPSFRVIFLQLQLTIGLLIKSQQA